jgi:chromosome segregation ATPase
MWQWLVILEDPKSYDIIEEYINYIQIMSDSIDSLNREINAHKLDITKKTGEKTKLAGEISKLERDIKTKQDEEKHLQDEINTLNTNIQTKEQKKTQLQRDIDKLKGGH